MFTMLIALILLISCGELFTVTIESELVESSIESVQVYPMHSNIYLASNWFFVY